MDLKEIVEYIVKSLVDSPQTVAVTREEDGANRIKIQILVGEHDLGRVIGKNGQTIRAIRVLAAALLPEGSAVILDVSKSPTP